MSLYLFLICIWNKKKQKFNIFDNIAGDIAGIEAEAEAVADIVGTI